MLLSNRLRVIRAERRVSQLRTALAAGIQPTRLWRIENGYAEPTGAERAAIGQTLGVSEDAVWPERACVDLNDAEPALSAERRSA